MPVPLNEAIESRMRRQRRAGTRPETELRRALHRRGLRYRVDIRPPVPGVRSRVDVLFTRVRVAVFVDGCYWHGCPLHATAPRHNAEWWAEKLAANRARDARVTAALTAAGYLVIRVWEHESSEDAATVIEAAVRARAEDLMVSPSTRTTRTARGGRGAG